MIPGAIHTVSNAPLLIRDGEYFVFEVCLDGPLALASISRSVTAGLRLICMEFLGSVYLGLEIKWIFNFAFLLFCSKDYEDIIDTVHKQPVGY